MSKLLLLSLSFLLSLVLILILLSVRCGAVSYGAVRCMRYGTVWYDMISIICFGLANVALRRTVL